MDVCALSHTPEHILRHMSQTGNNKRRSLIIRSFANSGYGVMRHRAHRWGFSYLDYSFELLVFWSRNLSF